MSVAEPFRRSFVDTNIWLYALMRGNDRDFAEELSRIRRFLRFFSAFLP